MLLIDERKNHAGQEWMLGGNQLVLTKAFLVSQTSRLVVAVRNSLNAEVPVFIFSISFILRLIC